MPTVVAAAQASTPEGVEIDGVDLLPLATGEGADARYRDTLFWQSGEDLTTEQRLLLNGLWTMVTTLNSNDLGEAMQAFMEKRPANFTGS